MATKATGTAFPSTNFPSEVVGTEENPHPILPLVTVNLVTAFVVYNLYSEERLSIMN